MSQLTDLKAQVGRLETVEASAIALLSGLKAKLDDAIAAGDPQALAELSAELGKDADDLAAAVAANTPAAAPAPAAS